MIRALLPHLLSIGFLSASPSIAAQSPGDESREGARAVEVASVSDDARKVLDRSIEAMGGQDALESIQSSRSTCHLALGEVETTMVMLTRKPDLFLSRHRIEGLGTMEMGFDGVRGWRRDPPDGILSEIDSAEATDFASRLDLQAMVRAPERTYREVSRLPDEIDGERGFAVLLMRNEERSARLRFDQETGLLDSIELVDPGARARNRRIVVVDWSDPGRMMPLRWVRVFRIEQPRETLTVTYDYVTFDDVSESTFIAPHELPDPEGAPAFE